MAFPRTLSARLLFYGGAVLSCMGAGKRERTDLSLGVEDLDVGTDMFENFWVDSLYVSMGSVGICERNLFHILKCYILELEGTLIGIIRHGSAQNSP